LWQVEPDALVLNEDPWATVGANCFDNPEIFAAYLNTRRWNRRHGYRRRRDQAWRSPSRARALTAALLALHQRLDDFDLDILPA
jgi:hypothetical protein